MPRAKNYDPPVVDDGALGPEQIREHWKRQADQHGPSPSASWSDYRAIELEIDAIASRLTPGAQVLDAGCGNGFSTLQYARRAGVEITGIDFVPAMIASADAQRRSLPDDAQARVRFAIQDVTDLEFADESFDQAISTRVIINLADEERQSKALRECARVLRPGGRLLLSEATLQGWERLNALRREWGLDPIPMPDFNRYLDERWVTGELEPELSLEELSNFAGSYYVATRVFKPLLAAAAKASVDVADPGAEFNRWAAQLPPAGDYGTQKLFVFRKR